MPVYQSKKILNHSQEKLYNLVANVEDYPNFLPWCKSVKVLNKYDNVIEYEITIGFKHFSEKFATKDIFNPYESILVEKIYGPFNHLQNNWQFEKIDDNKCLVSFFIDFSVKSGILSLVLSPLFKEAAVLMVSAFEKRANILNL